jgi:hypothetical protein
MSIPRSFASVLFVGLIPFVVGCGSDKKANNAPTWAGRTYLLDVPDSHWREPGEAKDEIGSSVPKFLLQVKSGSGNALDVLIGTSDANGVQDTCSPTTTVSATSQYPGIQIGPANVPLRVGDKENTTPVIATVYQLTMTDVLVDTAGATGPTTSQLTAILDARDVYSIFYKLTDPTPDSVCMTLANIDSPCTACPDDDDHAAGTPDAGSGYCVKLRANGLAAGPLSGVSIQPLTESDLAASCKGNGGI